MLSCKSRLATVLVTVLSLILVAFPLYDFNLNLYGWHFKQRSFVLGGIELLLIAITLFVFGYLREKKWKFTLLIGITEGYLRRHNVDLALLIAFLFADSLIGLGSIFFRGLISYKIPTLFIAGASLFVLISMGLSPFGMAKMIALIVFSVTVLVLFYATSFKESLLCKLFGAVSYIYNCDNLTRWISLSLYACILMLAAKTAYGINYDEAWYSLRLIEVLNPHGNYFEDLKMLGNWVHVYPKFFEILIFPLQYFESFTISRVFCVVVLGVGLIAVYEFWEDYRLSAKQKMLMSIVFISIPVVAGTATNAKADFFAGFVFLLSVLYFLKGIKESDIGSFLMAICMLILTLAIKLSAMGYVFVFFFLYLYAAFNLRLKLANIDGKYLAITSLFIASFCAVTLRTFLITGVPFVTISEISPVIASFYGMLGMEYNYPYGNISTFSGSPKISPAALLFRVFLFPSDVRQAIGWISNISIPIVSMAVIWFLKFKRGKFETLVVVFSSILMIVIIAFVFNNKALSGGDGNYYLMPMMVIIVVGATAFKFLREYSQSIVLMSVIYIVGSLPIAFVSSQSWHMGTRGIDLKFNNDPFDKKETQKQITNSNGLQDVQNYFTNRDQDECIAIGQGSDFGLHQIGCRYESVSTILWARAYLNSSEDSFIRMLKAKGVTHLVIQNYFPNSYFGRFCRLLIDNDGAKVSQFENYNVIDIRDIKYDELKSSSILASKPINGINLDNTLPSRIKALNSDVEGTSNPVNFNPPRSGIGKYYSPEDKVTLIKSDALIEFLVDAKGQCVNSVNGYFAKQINSSGQKLQSGKFTVAIASAGKIINEKIFSLNNSNFINGDLSINEHLGIFKVSVKYESNGGQLKPNIPAVIVNLQVRYCD